MQVDLSKEFHQLYEVVSSVLAAGHRDRITQGQLLDIVHQLDGHLDAIKAKTNVHLAGQARPRERRYRKSSSAVTLEIDTTPQKGRTPGGPKTRRPRTTITQEDLDRTAHLTAKEAAATIGCSYQVLCRKRREAGQKPPSPGQLAMADAGFTVPETEANTEDASQ